MPANSSPSHSISVVGLGKLGVPMVACFASKGHRVIGVDINPKNIELINQTKSPVIEPQVDKLLFDYGDKISATLDFNKAIQRTDITFIVVPTPSNALGGFSTEYAQSAAISIGKALRHKDNWHLVVLTSTVLPGSTEQDIIPALEDNSGKKCGIDFGFCYNPEFIALGSVVRNMLYPDFTLIGEYDTRSGDVLEEFYKKVVENNAPVARMNIVNAELAKISVNTFVTTKISYANMLAEICEKIPGCNVDVVTSAIGLDTRIGAKYIKGALGYGGPCFPRDNVAFAHMARNLGVKPTLAEATDAVNQYQIPRLKRLATSFLPENGTIGILGLSYKPDTDVVEESQGLELARTLLATGISISLYDPQAMPNAKQELENDKIFSDSLEDCVRQSDVIVITTPWKQFQKMDLDILNHGPNRKVVIDAWRILDETNISQFADYITLGVGS